MKKGFIVAVALFPLAAWARMPAVPPVEPPPAAVGQGQLQGQIQGQRQAQYAAGGDAQAQAVGVGLGQGGEGGAGGAGGQGGDSEATANAVSGSDSSSSQAVSVNGVRQVGLLYLPAIIPPACGAAVSAGHANTRNATAAGVAWTTERCWTAVIATDYERMGDYETACELRKDVVRKQLKRIGREVNCAEVAASIRSSIESERRAGRALVPPEMDSRYATQEELKRAFEAAQKK